MKKRFARCVMIAAIVIISSPYSGHSDEMTAPVIDGMTLKLENYAQRVEVRAKSLGIGVCAVSFSIAGEEAGFLAPPQSWSAWTEIGPGFFGPSAQQLKFRVNCDTGAVAEVRYSSP